MLFYDHERTLGMAEDSAEIWMDQQVSVDGTAIGGLKWAKVAAVSSR